MLHSKAPGARAMLPSEPPQRHHATATMRPQRGAVCRGGVCTHAAVSQHHREWRNRRQIFSCPIPTCVRRRRRESRILPAGILLGVALASPHRSLAGRVDTLQSRRDGAAGEAVEPVVVGLGGPEGPLADGAPKGLDFDPLLALGDMAGEEREAAAVAGEPGPSGR